MNVVDLTRHYVKDVPCSHCNGSGKCSCDYCKNQHQHYFKLVNSPIKPPVNDIRGREVWDLEMEMVRKEAKKKAKSATNCADCGGTGKRGTIDHEKLGMEVQEGKISIHEKYAIVSELGKTFGPSYFT